MSFHYKDSNIFEILNNKGNPFCSILLYDIKPTGIETEIREVDYLIYLPLKSCSKMNYIFEYYLDGDEYINFDIVGTDFVYNKPVARRLDFSNIHLLEYDLGLIKMKGDDKGLYKIKADTMYNLLNKEEFKTISSEDIKKMMMY